MPETEDNKQLKEPFGGDAGRARAAQSRKEKGSDFNRKSYKSYPNRLLTALMKIIEAPDSSIGEKLQAVEMCKDILPMRKVPRRKTDKEKMIIAALKGKEPKS